MQRDECLDRILQMRGAVTRVAQALGISTAAVSQWRRVPDDRVRQVADVLGVPAADLRPDLYETMEQDHLSCSDSIKGVAMKVGGSGRRGTAPRAGRADASKTRAGRPTAERDGGDVTTDEFQALLDRLDKGLDKEEERIERLLATFR